MLRGPSTQRDRTKLDSVISERSTEIDGTLTLSFNTKRLKFGSSIDDTVIKPSPLRGKGTKVEEPQFISQYTPLIKRCSVFLNQRCSVDKAGNYTTYTFVEKTNTCTISNCIHRCIDNIFCKMHTIFFYQNP